MTDRTGLMQREEPEQLHRHEFRSRCHARTSSAEKANDERAAKGLDHEAGVAIVGKERQLPRIKQRPQRHADDANGQQGAPIEPIPTRGGDQGAGCK